MPPDHPELYRFTQPDVRPTLPGESTWPYKLAATYDYVWSKRASYYRLRIEAPFFYDGASTPFFIWWLGFLPDGEQRAAALLHDFIYRHEGRLPVGAFCVWDDDKEEWVDLSAYHWTREQADRLFCRLMREAGVSLVKRRMMYRGVRTFGWMFWSQKRNKRS